MGALPEFSHAAWPPPDLGEHAVMQSTASMWSGRSATELRTAKNLSVEETLRANPCRQWFLFNKAFGKNIFFQQSIILWLISIIQACKTFLHLFIFPEISLILELMRAVFKLLKTNHLASSRVGFNSPILHLLVIYL